MLGTLVNSLDFSATGYEISSCLLFRLKIFLTKLRDLEKISFSEFFNHQPNKKPELDHSSLRFNSNCLMYKSGNAAEIEFDPFNTFIKLEGIDFQFKECKKNTLETLAKKAFKFKVGQLISFGGNNDGIDHLYVLKVIINKEEKVLFVGDECKREEKQLLLPDVIQKRTLFIDNGKDITVNGGLKCFSLFFLVIAIFFSSLSQNFLSKCFCGMASLTLQKLSLQD